MAIERRVLFRYICDGCGLQGPDRDTLPQAQGAIINDGWLILWSDLKPLTPEDPCFCPECVWKQKPEAYDGDR